MLCAVVAACSAGYIHHAPTVSHNVVHHGAPAPYSVQTAESYHAAPAVHSSSVAHVNPVVHAAPAVHSASIAHGSGYEGDHYVGEFVSIH